MKFEFWQKWLLIIIIIIITYGFGLAFFGQTELYNFLLNHPINIVFWDSISLTPELLQYQKFVYGVVGTTVIGWGAAMLFIVLYPFNKKEKWAWQALTISLSIWFFTDTPISIYYKAYSNAFLNVLLYTGLGLPLILTHKHFK